MDKRMMMTMTMKDEVLSWLNDEESLVTSQRISQQRTHAMMSRKDASSLLQSIWEEESDDQKYHATVCIMESSTHQEATSQTDDSGMGYSTTGEFFWFCFQRLVSFFAST
jgi:hypothetical protein